MDNSQEVSLLVEGQVFIAKKDLLCEHSDYFRAMFSGNYVEQKQQKIVIDVIDSNSMNIILRYMEIGLIDLSELSLTTIGDLAIAANFLQITELMKQIEYCLELQLSLANCMDTMVIAENSSYSKLECYCAAYGLFAFKSMKVEYIPSIHKLFWYLSHPYLDAECELDVFKFGLQWILQSETGADALLIILGCLDVSKLTTEELKVMQSLTEDFKNSLAEKVIECLITLSTNYELSVTGITKNKSSICETFTERVYTEVLNLVRESVQRKLEYIPVVPMWVLEDSNPKLPQHYMYTFTKRDGCTQWLSVAEKDLWGWSVASWGATKLVVVCGEHGRGTGLFMKDVKLYNTLTKEWTKHGVQLPPRRHGGIAVMGDTLYLIGGVGGFRVVLDSAVAYDLNQRSYRKIAKIPDALQNPAVCVHKNKLYVAGHKNIYVYEDSGDCDRWRTVLVTDIRANCMVSFKDYIYCTQNYFNSLYRFKPDVDRQLEMITNFSYPPGSLCSKGGKIIAFTRAIMVQADILAVEELTEQTLDTKLEIVWSQENTDLKLNEVAGCCALVMDLPMVNTGISHYHKRYLSRYE